MRTEVEFSSRFPEIIAALPEILDAAVAEGAHLIEQSAKERVPVRTGKLRDAIHVERTGLAEYEVIGSDDEAWYGHLVEFGTSHSAAEPFLIPAKEARRAEVVHIVDVAVHGL